MLQIETVGLDQYAPGGSARVQVLIAGPPGAGKTRMSSFFPRPIYADCEDGLASVADRGIQRVRIRTPKDMLDLLVLLKRECQKPEADRRWDTLVVDTVDAFQRLTLEAWHEANPRGTNNKYDIWNDLGRQMAMLTTRALNLDMNVVMLVHESTKEIDEEVVHGLQLKGGGKEEIFNDFDLVGWLRTEWHSVDGERKQRRLLTFHPRPGREWLKDRLHVTPSELEVTFDESDYTQLFAAIVDRLDEFPETEVFDHVPAVDENDPDRVVTEPTEDVVAPDAVVGAMPPEPEPEQKLSDLKKDELLELGNEMGVDVKTSMLKADIIAAIEAAKAKGDEVPDEVEAQPELEPEEATAVEPEPEPEPEPEKAEEPKVEEKKDEAACASCDKSLSGENPDIVRLSHIKYREHLCESCFKARKKK